MSIALHIPVKESMKVLKVFLKSSIPFIQPRVKLLIVMKKYDNIPVSKRELMKQTGLYSDCINGVPYIKQEELRICSSTTKKGLNLVLYNTLLKFCVKNFGSKLKVARKYHAKESQESVEVFKKTLLKSAQRL